MTIYLLMLPGLLFTAWMIIHIKWLQNRGSRSPFNENILRVPGHSIGKTQQSTALDFVLYLSGVYLTPFFAYAITPPAILLKTIFYGLALMATVWFLYKAGKLFKTAIRLHQAVEAEMTTGQELIFLMRDGAWVFHDIPYQYGNIDHVIIGSGGVFAIETKGYSKPTRNSNSSAENATAKVKQNMLILPHARAKKPIGQAKTHAKWLYNEIQHRFGLTVPVRAVVALPGWMVKGGFDGDCWVINPKRGNALRAAVIKPLFSDSEVNLIASWIEDLVRSIEPKSKEFDAKSELAN